jgi:hypothetical protein
VLPARRFRVYVQTLRIRDPALQRPVVANGTKFILWSCNGQTNQ